MGWFTKYPGTDYSQITLDHIMLQLSELSKTVSNLVARVIRLENQGGGTTDYDDLTDKPQINSVTLQGNKSTSDLNIDADAVGAIEAPSLTGASAGWYLRLSPALKWVALPGANVNSVNGKTGTVTLDSSDVGAVPEPTSPSSGDVIMWNGVEWEATNMGTVFNIKGEVATVADLPPTGNTVGDVYYVSSVSAGYIWLETTDHPTGYWEELGEPIDLSGYIAKPVSPSAGDYLAWDNVNQAWVAQALPLYDGS